MVVAGSAPNWRNGVILAQENDRWIVSAGGFLGDDAPDNESGFLAYLATLPTKEICDIVARAEPLTDLLWVTSLLKPPLVVLSHTFKMAMQSASMSNHAA